MSFSRRPHRIALLGWLALALMVGCGGSQTPDDAGSSADATTPGAADANDAGTVDAGVDAGAADASDAGTDAGALDAGTLDAGTLDAGTPDAGGDAGTATDAGASDDAGDVDAGPAYVVPDGGWPVATCSALGYDGGCANFAGAYLPVQNNCTTGVFTPPAAFCVAQDGCDLTVYTNQSTYVGCAQGSSVQLSADDNLVGYAFHTDCDGTQSADGGMDIHCHTYGSGHAQTCDTTFAPPTTIPDATSVCCDVTAQSCGDGEHCTLAYLKTDGSTSAQVLACLPTTATAQEGEACTLPDPVLYNQQMQLGHDNCGDGLLCTPDFAASSTPTCRRLCRNNSQCAATDDCVNFGLSVPSLGICLPTCQPLGSDCMMGTTCRPAVVLHEASGPLMNFICDTAGPKTVGDSCQRDAECPAGSGCFPGGDGMRCRLFCDQMSPCADTTQTCSSLNLWSGPAGLGYCIK